MSSQAFTGGVRPGGLNDSTQIRILLCYLLKQVGTPLTRAEIENALLGEELVNYFELSDALDKMCQLGHLKVENDAYRVTGTGAELAATLQTDLPRTVREAAVNAVLAAQQYKRRQAQHKTRLTRLADGWQVRCAIEDLGEEVFTFSLYLPDELSARAVQEKFINEGDVIFRHMLALLTGHPQLAQDPVKPPVGE